MTEGKQTIGSELIHTVTYSFPHRRGHLIVAEQNCPSTRPESPGSTWKRLVLSKVERDIGLRKLVFVVVCDIEIWGINYVSYMHSNIDIETI